jgi:hypothetical protein
MTPTAWKDEKGNVVADGVDAFGLAVRFEGVVARLTHRGTVARIGLPCGPDCLRRQGCWTYRTYYAK